MAKIKKTDEDVEKLKLSHIADEIVNWCTYSGKVWQFLKMLNIELDMFFTCRYVPQRNENICPHKNMNVHSSIIHDRQKVETTQMSINR